MIRHWSRRKVVRNGLALAASLAASRGYAQELTQNFTGEGTYWQPVVTALYARREDGQPVFPEGDGPPEFPDVGGTPGPDGKTLPATPEEAARRGLLHFTLNAPPADSAPNIDTDWLVYDRFRNADEHVSAIAAARQFGKRRLWLHRCREEEYLAVYPANVRLYLHFGADVGRERFQLASQVTGPAREAFVREKVQIVEGKLVVQYLNKVRKNGAGGEPGETLKTELFTGSNLADFAQRAPVEFVPRAESTVGELLDGALRVSLELTLEAGAELGLPQPERRKVNAEIRLALGEQYLDFLVLSFGRERKQ
jgi:hypothetical protein